MMIRPILAVSHSTGRMSNDGGFRYHSYSPSAQRKENRSRNRRSAVRMRLILVTCMEAAAIGQHLHWAIIR
jgi:hypothetical protein